VVEERFVTLESDPDIMLRTAQFRADNRSNNGKTIVIIPGYFCTVEEREVLARELSSRYNVLVFEPRGYGKSSKKRKKGIYGIDSYAREMRELFQILKLRNNEFAIFGSSLAVSAMHQYTAYMDGIKPEPAAMIMTSPAPKYREAGIFKLLSWMPNIIIAFFQRIVFLYLRITRSKEEWKNLDYAERRFKELDPWIQRRIAIETVGRIDFRDGEKDISIPICVFTAGKDDFTDPKDAKKYVHHPKSELITVDIDAHRFIEGNETLIAKHIISFLENKIWVRN
jgi:pimeloyl-ACP methyl ester carboxylesterase